MSHRAVDLDYKNIPTPASRVNETGAGRRAATEMNLSRLVHYFLRNGDMRSGPGSSGRRRDDCGDAFFFKRGLQGDEASHLLAQ
jgi:hypothetical protein